MEKIKIIKKDELDFKLNKIKEIKRIDIHSDYIEIVMEIEDGI